MNRTKKPLAIYAKRDLETWVRDHARQTNRTLSAVVNRALESYRKAEEVRAHGT